MDGFNTPGPTWSSKRCANTLAATGDRPPMRWRASTRLGGTTTGKLTVYFDLVGKRRLAARYANLELL